MRKLVLGVSCILLLAGCVNAADSPSASQEMSIPTVQRSGQTLTIGAWNIANLYAKSGVPLRARSCARRDSDFSALATIATNLDADVVALQEINSEAAARRVFGDSYAISMSGRRAEDIAAGRFPEAESKGNGTTDGIYTAIAARDSLDVQTSDYEDLSVVHTEGGNPGRPTRWGKQAIINFAGYEIHFLSVHLKSRCHEGSLENARKPDCKTLAAQIPPLRAWIDEREAADQHYIIAGDFNRRFEKYGQRDHLWQQIDDNHPGKQGVFRLPLGARTCWTGEKSPRTPIDFLVFSDSLRPNVVSSSCRRVDLTPYKPEEGKMGCISDHQPIVVDLELVPFGY